MNYRCHHMKGQHLLEHVHKIMHPMYVSAITCGVSIDSRSTTLSTALRMNASRATRTISISTFITICFVLELIHDNMRPKKRYPNPNARKEQAHAKRNVRRRANSAGIV
jgi:hypothetical protein